MFTRLLAAALFVALAAGFTAPADDKADAAQIDKLVEQLGSGTFAEREKASKELDRIGAPALEALRKAAKSPDFEVRKRAEALVKSIERRTASQTLLAPKRVRLAYKDTPLKDALEDFRKQSGYEINLFDPDEKLGERKITLDTGDATFWQAFDQFCDKAGLIEASPQEIFMKMRDQVRPQPPQAVPPAKDKAPEPPDKPPADKEGKKEAAPPPPPRPAPAIKFPPMGGGRLTLMEAKPKPYPTHYAGAVRLQARPNGLPPGDDGMPSITLRIAAEPRIQVQQVQGVKLEKAVDDQGQKLQQATPVDREPVPPAALAGRAAIMMAPRYFPGATTQTIIFFQAPEKPAKSIKELAGVLSLLVLPPPQDLITVDDLLKAAGKTVKGKDGGYLKVLEASKEEDGQLKLRVELQMPEGVTPAGGGSFGMGMPGMMPALPPRPAAPPPPKKGRRMQVAPPRPAAGGALAATLGGMGSGLRLVDDKGQTVALTAIGVSGPAVRGGPLTVEYTLAFQPQKDQGESFKLIFAGSRAVPVDVPFAFKDVPVQ